MTRLQGVGVLGVAFACIAGAVGFLGAACEACTPGEQAAVQSAENTIEKDAFNAEPYVFGGCALAADVPPIAGVIDLICPEAEAVDKAIGSLAAAQVQAKVVSTSTLTTKPDGGAHVVTLYRVRCQLAMAIPTEAGVPRDGGGQ